MPCQVAVFFGRSVSDHASYHWESGAKAESNCLLQPFLLISGIGMHHLRFRQKAWPPSFQAKGLVRGSGKRLDLAPSGQKVPLEAQAKGLTLLLRDKRSRGRLGQKAWPRSFGQKVPLEVHAKGLTSLLPGKRAQAKGLTLPLLDKRSR